MDEQKVIFLPVCVMVGVIILVWIWMYITRIAAIRRSRIPLQDLSDSEKEAHVLKDVVNPSDNLENLFEIPTLFFVLALSLFIAGSVDSKYMTGAWIFVAFRALHSFIHCTSNLILFRFTAYFLSTLVLWGMWIRFGINIL